MTVQPHPIVMTTLVKHRAAELRAQADRYRMASLAERTGGHRRQPGPKLRVFVAVAVALAVLLAAGRATAAETPSQSQQDVSQAAAQVVGTVLAEDDPVASAVQKVREAAN